MGTHTQVWGFLTLTRRWFKSFILANPKEEIRYERSFLHSLTRLIYFYSFCKANRLIIIIIIIVTIIIIVIIIIIIIIIMQNLYSAISVSSMALYNNCNPKKKIHMSY